MKTICIDARMLNSAGIGVYLRNLLKVFKKSPYLFKLIVHSEHLEQIACNEQVVCIPLPASIYSVSEQVQLPLKIPKCDLFWSPHYNVPMLPIRARRRMVTIHDAYHLAFFKTLSPAQKVYAKVVMHAAVRLSDRVITDSEFSKGELQKYTAIEERKLNVIPLGVDPLIFQLGERDEAVLHAQGLPRKFILFVGNLKPHKNLKGLLKAFHLLVKKGNNDLGLVIVGRKEGFQTGEDAQELLGLYPDIRGQIYFLGRVQEELLALLYRLAQVYVLPSFYEGFGLPPLEAMSSGCPTIVSQCGSLPEVCGEAALYVNPHSPEEMVQAMQRVLVDEKLKVELQQKGRERSQQYSWERCADKHLELIDALLK